MRIKKHNNIKVLDLFCGCGGLSYGFILAGFDVVMGVDNDEPSLETFKANHKGAKALNIDLYDKNFIKQLELNLTEKVDVIVGGPPCQGFSLTGPRDFDDRRNKLYLAALSSIKHFKPKAFVIENVPGLVHMYNGEVKDEIIKRCEKLGYRVGAKILTSADYGVPQLRRRVFFVGIRKDLGIFNFPKPKVNSSHYVTTSEAIGDLPSREKKVGQEIDRYHKQPKTKYQKFIRDGSTILYNHVASQHTQKIIEVIAQVPDGGNYKDLPNGVGEHRNFHEAWTRYSSNKPSKTIDTGHRNHFHYKWNRIPTVRENARLQSFPDTFIFKGSRTNQQKQVGNAVPPLMAKAVAENIWEAINVEN